MGSQTFPASWLLRSIQGLDFSSQESNRFSKVHQITTKNPELTQAQPYFVTRLKQNLLLSKKFHAKKQID